MTTKPLAEMSLSELTQEDIRISREAEMTTFAAHEQRLVEFYLRRRQAIRAEIEKRKAAIDSAAFGSFRGNISPLPR